MPTYQKRCVFQISDHQVQLWRLCQNSLHMRESLTGRYLQLVSPGAKDHMGRTGTDGLLSSRQNRKASTLLYGLETKWPPLASSSCELRLLTSPWRSSPPPRHLMGPGAMCQREVNQEKTNLLIRFINLSRLTLRRGSWFNTSCSEVSCWRAEGWGQSVGRKWKERMKVKQADIFIFLSAKHPALWYIEPTSTDLFSCGYCKTIQLCSQEFLWKGKKFKIHLLKKKNLSLNFYICQSNETVCVVSSIWWLTSLYTGGGRKRNSWTKAMRGRSRIPLRSSAGCWTTALLRCSASSSVTTEL